MEFNEAREKVLDLFVSSWPDEYRVEYQNKRLNPTPHADETWGRINIAHAFFGQRTLSDDRGKKRFNRTGNVFVNIFTKVNTGLDDSDNISLALLNSFEGRKIDDGNIWFKNTFIKEIGFTDAHYQVNFLTEFNYTTFK